MVKGSNKLSNFTGILNTNSEKGYILIIEMEVEVLKNKFLIFTILLMIFLSPLEAFAEEDLNISNWIVEADLLEDGSLSIIQDVSYDFNNDFNGVYVNIILDNIIGISDLEVSEIISGQEIKYSHDQRAKKGQSGVFSSDLTDDYINVMIFSPSENESKTFRMKYILNDVAAIHSDTGELYYKFIGSNNDTPIDYFKANINLPSFNQEDIKIFAHGPLNGNINFDKESIFMEVSDLPSNTFVEARILFPLDYIPLATRDGNKSLDLILKEEADLIENIKEEAIRKENRKSMLNNVSIGLSSMGLLIFAFVSRKLKRKPDIFENMHSIYPDKISPAELNLFMDSIIGPRAYLATLLDLARKEYLEFETISPDTKPSKWYKSKKSNDYLFIKKNKTPSGLIDHEVFFINWLFDEIGDGQRVSTDDIDSYREKSFNKFHKSQTSWSKIVKKELESRGYYDSKGKEEGFLILVVSIILLITSIASLINGVLFGLLSLLISIILIVYGISLFFRKSDAGYIQHQLWKDFKKDNTVDSSKNLGLSTDLSLIYQIALGLAMKDLDKYRESIASDYYPMHWGYYYFLMNNKGGSSFEDKFNNSFYGSTGSSSSSSFGGGGGFTGGGGGGVGGSGSGGF